MGGLLAFCALFCLAFAALIVWSGSEFGTAFWIFLGSLVFFGLPSFRFLGVAIKRPVAFRIDKNGISGYYADPATWREIADINVVTDGKGRASVGFALIDPVGFRDKQTPWRRFTYWSNGRGLGHHVIISHLLLGRGQAMKLADQARAFKAAAAQ